MVATVSSALLSIGLVTAPRAAEVVRIEGQSRAIVTDIEKTAPEPQREVRVHADFFLITPKRIERTNGAVGDRKPRSELGQAPITPPMRRWIRTRVIPHSHLRVGGSRSSVSRRATGFN